MGHIQRSHLSECEGLCSIRRIAGRNVMTASAAQLLSPDHVENAHCMLCRPSAEVRDTLLPRLISGQLRLPEAQAQLEDALA
jgi:type I restriction enzyme S subunit